MLPYKYFMIFESILKVDPQFLEIIKTLQSSGDVIASALSNLIENDIKTNLNYIRPGKANDELIFINDTQVKRIIDADQNPFDKTGNVSKVGRAIRQILDANGIKIVDKDIEDFVNRYKNAWDDLFDENKKQKIRLVKGEEIRYWYLEDKYLQGGGSLNNSCMRYDSTQTYLNIYVENPNRVNLLIYLDDDKKLKARSLIWFYEENGVQKVYQDRIYTVNDSDQISMHNWFMDRYKNSLSYRDGDYRKDISVKLDKFLFKEYPYMDSLYYLDFKLGIIKTQKGSNKQLYALRQTNGSYNVEGHYWSSYQNEWIPERDCVYIHAKKENSNEEIGYVHRNICVQDWQGDYILKDRAVESKLYGLIDTDSAIEVGEWGIVPKGCLMDVVIGIDDSGKMVSSKMPDKLVNVKFSSTIYTEGGSLIYAINELSFKTLIGRNYIKPESKWLSNNLDLKIRLCELVKVRNSDCIIKRVARFSVKYPYTYYIGDNAVGFNLHNSSSSTIILDHFYTTQLYVDKYNLEKISDEVFYFNFAEFYYNLYSNDVITNEILDSFDGEEKENLKKADAFLSRHTLGYTARKETVVYTRTYNREVTLEKLNEHISKNYLTKFRKRLIDAINFDDNTILDRASRDYDRLYDTKRLKKDLTDKIRIHSRIEEDDCLSYMRDNFGDIDHFLYNLYLLGINSRERLSRVMFPNSIFINLYEITYSGNSSFGDNFYHTTDYFIQRYEDILSREGRTHLRMLLENVKLERVDDEFVLTEDIQEFFLKFKEKYLPSAF